MIICIRPLDGSQQQICGSAPSPMRKKPGGGSLSIMALARS